MTTLISPNTKLKSVADGFPFTPRRGKEGGREGGRVDTYLALRDTHLAKHKLEVSRGRLSIHASEVGVDVHETVTFDRPPVFRVNVAAGLEGGREGGREGGSEGG